MILFKIIIMSLWFMVGVSSLHSYITKDRENKSWFDLFLAVVTFMALIEAITT